MATDHQQGSVSVIDLTDDSLNELITCNNNDKQIVPYVGDKTVNNYSIEAHSTELSNVKDNLAITFEQPNENDSVLQEDIDNFNTMENIYLRLVGETLSEATNPY